MNEIRNIIITISGEPVSGKSTVVKALKNKYEQMGYTVHIISVGEVFRELAKKEYLKMYPDRKDANISDIQTDETFKEKRNLIDGMVDGEVERRGKEINNVERPNDVYIIDSRYAWGKVPSYAIRLVINEQIAGDRVFKDKSRGSEDRYNTVEEATEKTRERKIAEIKKFKEIYGADLTNPENFDLIVDTSYSKTEELADIIIKGVENYRKGNWYPKYWKSPALFLPSQKKGETITASPLGFSLEEVAESIKESGYNTKLGTVDVVETDGIDILKDGHHRAIGALLAGKTLIPYEIVHKDDEFAKEYASGHIKYSDIYDWEDSIKYYAKMGKIENLKNFDVCKVMNIDKINKLMEGPSYPDEDGR